MTDDTIVMGLFGVFGVLAVGAYVAGIPAEQAKLAAKNERRKKATRAFIRNEERKRQADASRATAFRNDAHREMRRRGMDPEAWA